jgi:hypothetical protein
MQYGAPPSGPPPRAPPPLPPGWDARQDPASARTYYVHAATGTTQWTPPADPPPAYAYPPPPLPQHALSQQQHYAQQHYTQQHAQPPPLPPAYAPQQPPPPMQPGYGAPSVYLGGAPPRPPPSDVHGSYGPPLYGGPLPGAPGASMGGPAPGGSNLIPQASAVCAGGDGRGSPLELEFSADGLKGRDLVGKSDPAVVVSVLDNGRWKGVGRTETVRNDESPHWSTRVRVTYAFELHQEMRFTVWDVDEGKGRSDDSLGTVQAPLGAIVSAGATQFRLVPDPQNVPARLGGKRLGTLTVRAHEVGDDSAGRVRVKLRLSARKLDRADGPLRKSDPYFQVEQAVGAGVAARSVLYRSEVVKNTLDPSWRPATFTVRSHGRPPHAVEIEIRLVDHDDRSSHDVLGVVKCTLADLAPMATMDVINEARKARKGSKYSNSGYLIVEAATVAHVPSLVAYTMGGCRMRFTCAVDFTTSNGPPQQPGTLHYTDGVTPSYYGQALDAVGSVIAPYMPGDQMLEAYGFGAVLPGQAPATTCFDFPLNLASGPGGDARVVGVRGLMDAYNTCVGNVQLSGPTNFAPILTRAMASSLGPGMPTQQQQHYSVLLILTDGQCADMPATIDKIVAASKAHPISIVIVGVGSADFSAMRQLDGDNKKLVGSTGTAVRDIVQFVQWKKGMSPVQLASEVLAEVPQALVEYMLDHNVQPNPPGPLYVPAH